MTFYISQLIHESQKERGKSTGYLDGGISLDSLNEQKSINDQKIDALLSLLQILDVPVQLKNNLLKNIESYKDIRKLVLEKKVTSDEALHSYIVIIDKLLATYSQLSKTTKNELIKSKILSLQILEGAKESGGQLRSAMLKALSLKSKLTDQELTDLLMRKAGVDQGIISKALNLGPQALKAIDRFHKSTEWMEVNKVYKNIILNATSGEFTGKASEFFNIISSALNIISKSIKYELEDIKTISQAVKKDHFNQFLFSISLATFMTLVTFALVIYFSKSTSKRILDVLYKISKTISDVHHFSKSLTTTGEALSSAAVEQSAAVQETAASASEINSMVKKSSESSLFAKEISEKSSKATEDNKNKNKQLIQTIEEIYHSSHELQEQIDTNNSKLERITSYISEIANKTDVIHDIVFQTKLLSFNASVEAARAGEHGKGFSVVAQEISNLASMSGSSAAEITQILETSKREVALIIEESKTKMNSIVSSISHQVKTSTNVAKESESSLNILVDNIYKTDQVIEEIASAAKEQSSGVDEVTKAVQQLDETLQINSSSASQTSEIAKNLESQIEELKAMIYILETIIYGKKKSASSNHKEKKQTHKTEENNHNNTSTQNKNKENYRKVG